MHSIEITPGYPRTSSRGSVDTTSHFPPSVMVSTGNAAPRQICTFFAMGGCNRGAACPYSHELTQLAPEGVDATGGFFISGNVANYRPSPSSVAGSPASVRPASSTAATSPTGTASTLSTLNPQAKAFHVAALANESAAASAEAPPKYTGPTVTVAVTTTAANRSAAAPAGSTIHVSGPALVADLAKAISSTGSRSATSATPLKGNLYGSSSSLTSSGMLLTTNGNGNGTAPSANATVSVMQLSSSSGSGRSSPQRTDSTVSSTHAAQDATRAATTGTATATAATAAPPMWATPSTAVPNVKAVTPTVVVGRALPHSVGSSASNSIKVRSIREELASSGIHEVSPASPGVSVGVASQPSFSVPSSAVGAVPEPATQRYVPRYTEGQGASAPINPPARNPGNGAPQALQELRLSQVTLTVGRPPHTEGPANAYRSAANDVALAKPSPVPRVGAGALPANHVPAPRSSFNAHGASSPCQPSPPSASLTMPVRSNNGAVPTAHPAAQQQPPPPPPPPMMQARVGAPVVQASPVSPTTSQNAAPSSHTPSRAYTVSPSQPAIVVGAAAVRQHQQHQHQHHHQQQHQQHQQQRAQPQPRYVLHVPNPTQTPTRLSANNTPPQQTGGNAISLQLPVPPQNGLAPPGANPTTGAQYQQQQQQQSHPQLPASAVINYGSGKSLNLTLPRHAAPVQPQPVQQRSFNAPSNTVNVGQQQGTSAQPIYVQAPQPTHAPVQQSPPQPQPQYVQMQAPTQMFQQQQQQAPVAQVQQAPQQQQTYVLAPTNTPGQYALVPLSAITNRNLLNGASVVVLEGNTLNYVSQAPTMTA